MRTFPLLSDSLWNRRFLNALWLIFFLSIPTETASMITTDKDRSYFMVHFLIIPTIWLLAILLIGEVVCRFLRNGKDMAIIIMSLGVSTVIINIHASINYIMAFFYLPIFLSVFYFKPKLVIFTTSMCIVIFYLSNIFNPEYRGGISFTEWVVMPFMLIGATLFSIAIMKRSLEIITNLERSQQEIERLAAEKIRIESASLKDALTGLHNHKSYHEYLDQLLCDHHNIKSPLQLAVMDIDNFKSINDTFGHRVGDDVLHRVSRVIELHMKEGDFPVRYGGEEFVVIFQRPTFKEAYEACERIRKDVAQLKHARMNGATISVSIGLIAYIGGLDKYKWFEKADQLMYHSKRNGKNKTSVDVEQLESQIY